MATVNETPRQKMISILYLVLLGMIALSVSTSVLDAFKNLKVSLITTTANLQNDINNTFTDFESTRLKEKPERARPIYDRAIQARIKADSLNNYINGIISLMEKEGGGYSAG